MMPKYSNCPWEIAKSPLRMPKKLRTVVPFNLPRFAIAPWNMRLFNKLYYGIHSDAVKIVDFNSFFYPLDSVENWNRIYGRGGFVQYQAWFPRETSQRGLVELLQKIAASQRASFLAVLKSCGQRDQAVLSYLEPGHTLALDFAQTGDDLAALFTELDRILLGSRRTPVYGQRFHDHRRHVQSHVSATSGIYRDKTQIRSEDPVQFFASPPTRHHLMEPAKTASESQTSRHLVISDYFHCP